MRAFFRVTLAGALLWCACAAHPQGNMTVEYRPKSVNQLAGIVGDTVGRPVPGAIVAECDSTYQAVIASTRTDEDGKFKLTNAKYGSKHYLKIDLPGFDEVRIPVTISLFAKSKIRIILHVGT